MSVPVTYYCPHCGAVVELEREGYLSDRSVTPFPLAGWSYVPPDEPFEDGAADGVRFVCGESEADGVVWRDERSPADDVADPSLPLGCRQPFYLSFVRYEEGREVDPEPESEYVRIGP
jgi:hypothetical protein